MIHYFTDPVLSAPTIGSMLMCLLAGFVGTFSVLLKRSLVGEALSHASYPGVILGLIIAKLLFVENQLIPLVGAALSSLLGIYLIQKLVWNYKIQSDSALTFVLASFFGVALVFLSSVQTSYPTLYREMQSYLFGQAATQTNVQVVLYLVLTGIVLTGTLLFYRPIKIVISDPEYAQAVGINRHQIYMLIWAITVLSVVVGIRSLGVVLMSSMLIFPAVTSRLWTEKLEVVLLLASLLGMLSGFFGVYMSHEMSHAVSFPTGPMIVVCAALFFILSAIFSPKQGLLFRAIRKFSFEKRCTEENLLKLLYKCSVEKNAVQFSCDEIAKRFQASLWQPLGALERKGWVKRAEDSIELTPSGMLWGRKIVRLHRLWEVYLVEYCEVGKDRVHPSAEAMEHIITPEIEEELEVLLSHPTVDPHKQPIPPHEVV